MKTTSTSLFAVLLLLAASAASDTGWRTNSVALGWVKQPNPDETGKSSKQRSKLLGEDTLSYTKVGEGEEYVLVIGDEHGGRTIVSARAPKGAALYFSGGRCDPAGLCEVYEVDRINGARASVKYSTNAPLSLPGPNTGLILQ